MKSKCGENKEVRHEMKLGHVTVVFTTFECVMHVQCYVHLHVQEYTVSPSSKCKKQ